MSRRLLIPTCIAALCLLGATLAQGEQSQSGNVRISFSGSFAPHSLPRDRPAPITVHLKGAISTTDETHPPAVQKIEFAINRNGRMTTTGLPTCTSAQLQATNTETAIERCGPSLVGRGRFGANVEFPSVTPVPATGRMLAFFGTRQGKPALLLHLHGTTPVQTTFVLPLEISRQAKGQFGTILSARIPTLAGGLGSVTEIDLRIGRSYNYRGQRHSFLSASCAAPSGFTVAIFPLVRGSFFFADGKKIETTLARDCSVR
ncbi:MAG TPA: hypothetical protein VFI03_04285 [Solirubrobacterales bacterium]|nr:hypothetical protein [Solirubrobacterales bacterium]